MHKGFTALTLVLALQAGMLQAQAQGNMPTEAQMQQQRDRRVEAYGEGDAQTAVQRVQESGLMNGFPDGTFHPERQLTRAELASILAKTFKLEARQPTRAQSQTAQETMLKDVPAGYWAVEAINEVVSRGIMRGYREGFFYPEQRVSRAEALAIFGQAYGVQQYDDNTVNSILSTYPDAHQIPDWARKAMATSLKNGFVEVESSSRIRPQQMMTRGDMAYALSQYIDRLHQSEQRQLR